ncbi:7-cyano-7-deazaguanine synthase QueC [Veillonella sp. VA142]|uniref:7-cyano-7-deazaguanine synthase QueC n=1 Tax=Veillonella sp. VA142 TaxID=741834 RepID=UPI000F8DFA83|nr:7-cyano-7-deazaguanine synthase QueC [Veillonella sp. VA142]
MDKVIVLSSGGVDSTTALALAVKEFGKDNVLSLSFFYGQKHGKELRAAQKIANYYGVNHKVFDIKQFMTYSNCSLLACSTKDVEEGSYNEQLKKNNGNILETYVPFRNGLLLSIATTIGMSLSENEGKACIYLGNHADDAAGNAYADCSMEFIKAMNKAIKIATYGKVEIKSPFVNYNKSQIVKLGIELKIPYELTWSCYNGEDIPCGKCGTCIDRINAFKSNDVKDPAIKE